MKTILGLDIGYGHVKCVLSTSDGAIQKIFKFPSSIGITAHNEFVSDSRIIDYKEHSYYVGEDALNLPSDNLVDITEYKNLEYYAPVFLYKVLKMIETVPDVIVTGLSKAQILNWQLTSTDMTFQMYRQNLLDQVILLDVILDSRP